MMWLVNRYSFLITSALAMGAAWLVGARFGGVWPSVAVAVAGLGLALIQRRLRGGSSDASAWEEIAATTDSAQPRLLFIYSDT